MKLNFFKFKAFEALVLAFLLTGSFSIHSLALANSNESRCDASVSPTKCSLYDNGGIAKGSSGTRYCGKGKCDTGTSGRVWCSSSVGGGISRGASGSLYCGIGSCVTSKSGRVWCSAELHGAATQTTDGSVTCSKNGRLSLNNCVEGQSDLCVEGEKDFCMSN
ncbi:MAG: hypothetical protein NT027_04965 [Proteobacteria bacterium]|nr:hypothetical protein [Pseudomonadota bacterium]